MLTVHRRLLEAVTENAADPAACFQGATHGRLVYALGSTGDQRPAGAGRESANRHRVVDERLLHMPRSDHSEATRLQQAQVTAAVQHGGRVVPQSYLQATWVGRIGSADHPDGTGLPALDHLAQ